MLPPSLSGVVASLLPAGSAPDNPSLLPLSLAVLLLLGLGQLAPGIDMADVLRTMIRRRSHRPGGPVNGVVGPAPGAGESAQQLEELGNALIQAARMPAPRLLVCRTLCAHLSRLPVAAALLGRDGEIVLANEAIARLFGAPSVSAMRGQTWLRPEADGATILAEKGRWTTQQGLVGPWSTRLELRLRYSRLPGDPTLPPTLLIVEDRLARRRSETDGRSGPDASARAFARIATELLDALMQRMRGVRGKGTSALRDVIHEGGELVLELGRQLRTIEEGFRHHGEVVDVARVLRQAVRLLRHIANTSVRMRIDPAAPPVRVTGCSGQLYEALLDLGLNARDAMPDEAGLAIALKVRWAPPAADEELEADAVGRYAVLSVRDEVPGLSDAALQDLFRFNQSVESEDVCHHPGLRHAHRCVEAYDGWIELETAPGAGTCFQIMLPIPPSSTS